MLKKWTIKSLEPSSMGSQGSTMSKAVPKVLETEGSDLEVLL